MRWLLICRTLGSAKALEGDLTAEMPTGFDHDYSADFPENLVDPLSTPASE